MTRRRVVKLAAVLSLLALTALGWRWRVSPSPSPEIQAADERDSGVFHAGQAARLAGAAIDRRMTGSERPGQRVAAQMRRAMASDLATSSSCADLRSKLARMRRMALDGEVAARPDASR